MAAGVLVVFYARATVFSANMYFCVNAHARSVIVIATSCAFDFFEPVCDYVFFLYCFFGIMIFFIIDFDFIKFAIVFVIISIQH